MLFPMSCFLQHCSQCHSYTLVIVLPCALPVFLHLDSCWHLLSILIFVIFNSNIKPFPSCEVSAVLLHCVLRLTSFNSVAALKNIQVPVFRSNTPHSLWMTILSTNQSFISNVLNSWFHLFCSHCVQCKTFCKVADAWASASLYGRNIWCSEFPLVVKYTTVL